jgi:AraC-like DNA-binding protein
MTKPFNFEILLSRIRNILKEQSNLKKTFVKHVEVKTSEIKTESPDEKFIQQALMIVEKNLSNADFSVEDLSRQLFISRVATYKRIFALTGKSPLDFIRSIRLQRAVQLLEKSDLTVAEVAYEVGFNNPKYFSKFFKAEYNIVPSAFQAERKKRKEMDNKQAV